MAYIHHAEDNRIAKYRININRKKKLLHVIEQPDSRGPYFIYGIT